MEYYAPVQGPPGSAFVGYEQQGDHPSSGLLPLEEWQQQQQHRFHPEQQQQQQHQRQQQQQQQLQQQGSVSSSPGDATGLEEAMWQLSLQSSDQGGMEMSGPYPERPGEPDCVYYMRTGLCAFGTSCRFNHPPNRKLAAAIARGKGEYPERPGQPECQYYLKTGTCKFGATCKYHHPRDKAGIQGRVQLNVVGLPYRAGEKECAYYMRTGSCKYGVTCKFHHPQPTMVPALYPPGAGGAGGSAGPSTPNPQHYPAGLPSWPLARAPYLASPRLQAPSSYTPVLVPSPQGVVSLPGWNTYHQEGQQHTLGAGYIYGAAAASPQEHMAAGSYNPYLPGSPTMGLPALQAMGKEVFPERPGMPECQYYIKTGDCKYGASCRFHHPKDRMAPSATCLLSPMGLPLRPGVQACSYYVRFGICKFGPTCKFDHPLAAVLGYSPSVSSLSEMSVYPMATAALVSINSHESIGVQQQPPTMTNNVVSAPLSRKGSEESGAGLSPGNSGNQGDLLIVSSGN